MGTGHAGAGAGAGRHRELCRGQEELDVAVRQQAQPVAGHQRVHGGAIVGEHLEVLGGDVVAHREVDLVPRDLRPIGVLDEQRADVQSFEVGLPAVELQLVAVVVRVAEVAVHRRGRQQRARDRGGRGRHVGELELAQLRDRATWPFVDGIEADEREAAREQQGLVLGGGEGRERGDDAEGADDGHDSGAVRQDREQGNAANAERTE